MQTKLRSDAFLQQAMDTCGDAVYRLALCRLNSRADAEDVCQELFLKLLTGRRTFRDAEHEKAFVIRAAGNACKNLLRAPHR
ncbi:MAG: sigma-70 family RNA polymerase sigma factor, partial [Agathobaculum butyriciproducens]|nr:sigma-70 family RNA polymerase sigma factor [Agathobaculum butyriciproducens]